MKMGRENSCVRMGEAILLPYTSQVLLALKRQERKIGYGFLSIPRGCDPQRSVRKAALSVTWRSVPALTRWRERVLQLVSRRRLLTVTNAYISTLGGGYFLCHYIGDAVRMACTQLKVAFEMQDGPLASRCWMHLAYCCLQVGLFGAAKRIIHAQRVFARSSGDEELVQIVEAARQYLQKLRKLKISPLKRERVEPPRQPKPHQVERGEIDTEEADSWYRQRVLTFSKSGSG